MKNRFFGKAIALVAAVTVVAASFASAMSVYASDPPEGTEEKGIVNVNGGEQSSSINASNIIISKYQKNGDFEEGLKYWTTTATGSNVYADETGNVKTEGENKYYQFDGKKRSGYAGLRSSTVGIPADKLSVGDKVALVFDYLSDGVNQLQVKFSQVQCSNGAAANTMVNACSVLHPATLSSNWKTLVTATSSAVVASNTPANDTAGIKAGDYAFFITIAVPGNATCTSGIDNIRLVKVKDGKYYDIEKGTEVTFPEVSDEEDLTFGTEESGFKVSSSSVVTFHAPLKAPMNLDFSQGLRFWAGHHDNGKENATDFAEIKTEGTNKYLNLKTSASWGGITTPVFKMSNVNPGDKITVVYDRKLSDTSKKYQMYLSQVFYGDSYTQTVDGGGRVATDINGATEIKAAGSDGWGTYAIPVTTAIKDPAGSDKGIYLRIAVQAQEINDGAPINVAFDNLRVAKVSADGKTYTDLLTNQVINPGADAGSGSGSGSGTGSGTGTGTGTGTSGGTGTGSSTGTSNKTGESYALLLSLLFVSACGVFGTAKALKSR